MPAHCCASRTSHLSQWRLTSHTVHACDRNMTAATMSALDESEVCAMLNEHNSAVDLCQGPHWLSASGRRLGTPRCGLGKPECRCLVLLHRPGAVLESGSECHIVLGQHICSARVEFQVAHMFLCATRATYKHQPYSGCVQRKLSGKGLHPDWWSGLSCSSIKP